MNLFTFTKAPHTPSERSLSDRQAEDAARADSIRGDEGGGDGKSRAPMERLVVRDMPYHQSSNSLRVRHQTSKMIGAPHWYTDDWFHVLLRIRTGATFLAFSAVWTVYLLVFAGVYMLVDGRSPKTDCGLGKPPDVINFHGAFAFSLETTTTVGYGLPNGGNGFFENCPGLQCAIYFQMLLSMFFNAFLLSFFFARISRSESRGGQVLFSDKAVLNREVTSTGIVRYVLSARVYDADSMHPTVEAHVRFYCVKHRSIHGNGNINVRFPMKMEPMRITIPDDELGGMLFTSLPAVATHHIDYHSPLCPPLKRARGPEDGRVGPDSGCVLDSVGNGLNMREDDSYVGSRDGLRCAICGETYASVANLIQHIRYNQHTESHDGVPVKGSHQELDVGRLFSSTEEDNYEGVTPGESTGDARIDIDHKPTPPWFGQYSRYLREQNIEIICVMEAIDPILSGTFQAIQSYTADDIEFDAEFSPCVLSDKDEGTSGVLSCLKRLLIGKGEAVGRSVKIDLDSFHKTVKVD